MQHRNMRMHPLGMRKLRRTSWKYSNGKTPLPPCHKQQLRLCRHDTDPSFLNVALEHDSTNEPPPKKARFSDPTTRTITISSKLSNGDYATLRSLREDAEHVSEELVAVVREKVRGQDADNKERLLLADLKQIQRVQAFEQVVKDVVEQESKYEAVYGNGGVQPKQEQGVLTNGHVPRTLAGAASRNSSVLTLFGNAPTPKQLFSSMQNLRTAPAVKTELPIEEMSLPNGLTATRIQPVPADTSKKEPTFDDVFPPAYNLPSLHPPKSHKRSTTRDTTIEWEFKDHVSRSNKKGGYTTQNLTVGDWLGYGGTDSKDDPSSPREKRKQRDRALSGGESSQAPLSRESLEDSLAKEEEALFRRAYSSFTPSCDNSKALVPEETKSMVWWHKVGHERYGETFAIDPALLDERQTPLADGLLSVEESDVKDEDFTKVIEELEELDEAMPTAEPARDKTEVDQVLREVSELLETLASHQRIRNASLPSSISASRTPISPAPTLASRIGRPDSPAEEEMSTYHSLRREFAYLILRLPPYAVAKLDGDQLSELGVSKLITFEGRDAKGTMEEDQVARMAKYTAMATAAGIASLTRTGSGSSQHYSSTSQRTPAIGQAANTRYGQSAQYGASRTPVQPQYQRSTSNQSSYGTPSATAPRPGYGQQPNQYSRPAAPQATFSGQQSGGQYQRPIQQTPSNYGSYGQQYGSQSTPQTQPRPTYASSQPLAQYQQRLQVGTQNTTAYQTNTAQSQQSQPSSLNPFTRTQSPIKPASYLQPQPTPIQRPPSAQAQQQPSSGRATPASYPSQPQTPVNGFQQPPQRPPSQQSLAPRGASGTPQPPGSQPQTLPVQANGHS